VTSGILIVVFTEVVDPGALAFLFSVEAPRYVLHPTLVTSAVSDQNDVAETVGSVAAADFGQ
ncbi:MAG: hypothetical protein WKF37_18460, partial [Bryobacteraceae bacterium]